MPNSSRRIIRIARQYLRNAHDEAPKWLILHYSYSDGGEMFEVRALEGDYPTRQFALRSQLDEWLRKRGRKP